MAQKSGQSLSEYGLIMGLVALLCLPALALMQGVVGFNVESMVAKPSKVAKVQPALPPATAVQSTTPAGGTPVFEPLLPGAAVNNGSMKPALIQVSGANGNATIVADNSNALITLASRYAQRDPETSNDLIKLGQLGQQMSQQLDKGDWQTTNRLWEQFTDLYGNMVQDNGVYSRLSTADQSLVQAISNQSVQLTSDFTNISYSGYSGLDNYDGGSSAYRDFAVGQVTNNSDQTIQCGKNLKCN